MRSQRRTKAPFTRDSLRRALEHHRENGPVRTWFEPKSTNPRWCVDLASAGLVEFTEAQLYALCVGLAASAQYLKAEVRDALDATSEAIAANGGRFTCEEADWIAKLHRLVGLDGLADAFLEAHGDTDGDEDKHAWTSCGACGQRVPGSHVCDLDPDAPRGRHVMEATEVFEHPAIAEQVPALDAWPGEIVGA